MKSLSLALLTFRIFSAPYLARELSSSLLTSPIEMAVKLVLFWSAMARAYETASKVDFLNLPPAFSVYTKTDILQC